MPYISVNQTKLFYEVYGSGSQTIVFSHGYLMTHQMFEEQIKTLKNQYKCIVYDHRGHGKSEVSQGGYDMDNLVKDAALLIKSLTQTPCHFVGMSTGGYVGIRLALQYPELVRSLVLIDTDAEAASFLKLIKYHVLLNLFKFLGFKPLLLKQILSNLFGKKFLLEESRKQTLNDWIQIITNQNQIGMYKFGKGIFSRKSVLKKIENIDIPTLVVVGDKDVATPLVMSERIVNTMRNATLNIISNSGHTSPVEEPEKVNEAILSFYGADNFFA